ncbi:hypothetical protein [Kitasatospora fiedleri]|uniref:hypothetical protein n=1 Tax=Kitasatospora fiedleri TaxID=2991545 RepID=UPI00249C60AD|nr:hypothetical protein [Kitasatospora fiedleri]
MAVLTITYEPVRTIPDTVPHPHRTLAGELLRWSAHAFRPDWKYTPSSAASWPAGTSCATTPYRRTRTTPRPGAGPSAGSPAPCAA